MDDFRRAVDRALARQLDAERAASLALVARVRPAVAAEVARARAAGALARAWLFGSMAWTPDHPSWDAPTERSDVDVLVEGCAAPGALADALEDATGRPVHLVAAERAPASLVERARDHGVPL